MRAFIVLSIIVLCVACNQSEQANLDATQKMFAAFNTHDWKAMADLYSDNAEFMDPSFGKEYVTQTKQQIVEKYSGMEQMFPDMHDDVKEMYAVEDKVVIQFVANGNSGDSIKLVLPICSILTFKDGKIIRDATYYDN